ncbi:TPA: hypothetical protein TZS71_002318, partial [Streptococcus suis]|nr:hypothetical protein [Streptococcus suis]
TRTVSYVDATGKEVAAGSSNSVTFTRSGEINHVTGEVTWTGWTAKAGDATLEGNPLPTVDGYIAKEATNNGNKVELDTTVANVPATETTGNITEVVTYVKLGSWIPQLPGGEKPVDPNTGTPIDPIVYPNDPNDPTKPGTEIPTIPYIPGTTPGIPDPENPDKYIPLKPVDPEDPTKGYEVPPVPSNPGEDTKITYVPSSQSGTVKFVDTTTNTVRFTENLTGNAGDEFGFDPADKIKEFEKLGYTVVNKDNYDKSGTFDS